MKADTEPLQNAYVKESIYIITIRGDVKYKPLILLVKPNLIKPLKYKEIGTYG